MKKSIIILFLFVSAICFSQAKADSIKPVTTGKTVKDTTNQPQLKDTCVFIFPKELAKTFDAVLTGQDFSHKEWLALIQMWQAQIPGLYKKQKK